MKRVITVSICILLALIFVVSLFGCDAFALNEGKDNDAVVATVNGEEITKAQFNDYLTFNLILYEINDYDIPTGEDELRELKENLFDDYIANLTYQCEAQSLGLETDSENVADSVNDMITATKEYYVDDETYLAKLADYSLTEENFETLITKELTLIAYANAYQDNEENDYSLVTEKTAVTVGDVELPNYILYYYVIMDELTTYLNEGTYPESEDAMLELFDTEIENIAQAQALITYGEEQGYEITQEQIDEAMASVDSVAGYFGESNLQYFYDMYYLTDEQVEEAKDFMGKAYAVYQIVSDETIAGIEPTDKEVEKYYKNNLDSYDESTASVYHILTTDKNFAKDLEEEAGGTGEGFMQVYEKYKDDASISEAAEYTDITKTSNYVPEFLDAIFSAKEGDVVGMVKTDYGYHLIYVYEMNEVDVPALDDIKDQVTTDYTASVETDLVNETFDDIYDSVKVKDGDYRMLTEAALIQALEEKYGVETNVKIALR